MGGIGPDIEEVINELGTLVTVLRAITFTEYITYTINNSTSRPFYREFMLEGSMTYNTKIISGDIIQFNGLKYLIANKTPETFENEVVEYAVVMFKCNFPSTAKILTYTETKNASSFVITQGWSVRNTSPNGLLFLGDWVTTVNSEVSKGRESTYRASCFVPDTYAVAINDRVWFTATEYYRVQAIERYEYPGIHILYLVEDDRIAYTP